MANLKTLTLTNFTTHSQLNDEEQASTGVTKDLVRLSVGIEALEDLKADLEQAFAKL